MRKYINRKWIQLIMFSIIMVACESTEETFQEFIGVGETIYVGKADTVIIAHGFEKLRFQVAINADPKISNGFLENIDGSVAHKFDVVRARNGSDTITFDVDLEEGEYTFGFFLLDDNGNKSVRSEVSTKVYGANYENTLTNRGIANIEVFASNAVIHWSEADVTVISTTLTYEDAAGVAQTMNIQNDDTETHIDSYKLGGAIMVSSKYKPQENAIEEFNPAPFETTFPDQFLLEKSIISALVLQDDASEGCHGSTYARLTDGSTGDFWHSCDIPGDQYPWIMSFDMGVAANLSRFRLDERSACCGGRSPADYQIWGTNDLAGAITADIDAGTIADWEADAIAKGWVKLLDVADNDQATFEVDIPENPTKFRYLRIVGISSIDGDLTANFDEFTFWATSVE